MNKQNADRDALRDPQIIRMVSLPYLPARAFVPANSKLLEFSERPRLPTPPCFSFCSHCLRCPFLATYLGTSFMSQNLGLICHLVKGGVLGAPSLKTVLLALTTRAVITVTRPFPRSLYVAGI